MKLSNEYLNNFILILFLSFFSTSTLAHTTNESTLFPDIKGSSARFDVILLVGIGIVPETNKFNPDTNLTRSDLAVWGALAHGLVVPVPGEAVDIQGIASTAMNKGIIDNLNGNASYKDINQVLFDGGLQIDSSETMPTRAQAAEFIVANLEANIKGESLLSRREMHLGPTGKVIDVQSKMNPDGGSTMYLTLGEESYAVYSHGKLANGPVDLKQWKGKMVRRSIVRNLGQFQLWVFLEAGDVEN
jgi:hypothetical protein